MAQDVGSAPVCLASLVVVAASTLSQALLVPPIFTQGGAAALTHLQECSCG